MEHSAQIIANIQPNRVSQRPYVSCLSHSVTYEALYDTGADICCLNEKIFRQIPAGQRPPRSMEHSPRQFTTAGGQALNVRGKYEIPIEVMGKKFLHPFYVVNGLSEQAIIGVDFIHKNQLDYSSTKKRFQWAKDGIPKWNEGVIRVRASQILPPLTTAAVQVNVFTEENTRPGTDAECLAQVAAPEHPLLTGSPSLIKVNSLGQSIVYVQNCSTDEVKLEREEIIGMIENMHGLQMRQLNAQYVNTVLEQTAPEATALGEAKKKYILDNMNIDVPEEYKERYAELILKHHDVISQHKHDLGRCKTMLHDISLKSNEPIYVKQFKIPDAHQEEVANHVKQWLKLGVVQPTRSKFNSPIFVVSKKDGGLRIVQDLRKLNAQSHEDKYSMKDISECIGEIGRANSTLYSTIDLTSGFWQMMLEPHCREYTAFTIPGMGQFEWVSAPQGLHGMPASFQRLMEAVMLGIPNVLVYIDDLLIHSKTHEEHLEILEQVFSRLRAHGLKMNLPKCFFGSKNVSYLGFRLTEEGIVPGKDKLKAVEKAQPPTSVHEIRQFLGLCNFFRTHVKNFAQVASPLTCLTKKECLWKKGPLPEEALKAFRELQSALVSEPVVDYPRKDRPYVLITDAALGDGEKTYGGFGAILTQIDEAGQHKVLSYASRKLQKHERNYTAFLLEMQGAIWAMNHFSTYLRGRHFTLMTDHKPLVALGKIHTRTLNRLQEAMNEFDFEIVYKEGKEIPADFLSRNVVNAISFEGKELKEEQDNDPFIKALKAYLLHKELPKDPQCERLVRHFSTECFLEDDVLWRRIKRTYEPSRVVIFLPTTLIQSVITDAHGELMSGHDGVLKTKERILQCYYWPGMDADILAHIKACHKCQLRKKNPVSSPTLLTPLPLPTEPNMRIHCDLYGPLRTSGNNKKYILAMTDAFTKYVELVALPSKEASVVTEAIFKKWICRYSCPTTIHTDGGKEFCNQLANNLYKLLGIEHGTTSPYTPQCNAQVERANQTITKYLASFVNSETLDWEDYLAPLMFCYNNSFHRSIKQTPHFMLYGVEPNMPSLPTADVRRKFYGEAKEDEIHQTLLHARDVARRNNEDAQDESKEDHDKKVKVHNFQLNQLVLLDEHSFLHKNLKLAPKWSGPHRITKIRSHANMELLLKSGKTLLVHAHRLKPYFVPTKSNVTFNEHERIKEKEDITPVPTQTDEEENDEEARNPQRPAAPPATFEAPRPPTHPFVEVSDEFITEEEEQNANKPICQPEKRKRGRPRKNFSAPNNPVQPSTSKPTVIMPQIMARPDPTISQNMGGIDDEAISGEIVDSVLLQSPDSEGWIVVIRKNNIKKKKNNGYTKQQRRNMCDTGDIFMAKSDGSYQLHSEALEDNTPTPSILQSEDTRSSDFNTPEALSEEEEEDEPPEVLDSEDSRSSSEEDTPINHPDPEPLGATARPPDPTPGRRTEEDHPQHRHQVVDPSPRTRKRNSPPEQPPQTFFQFLAESFGPHTRSKGPAPPTPPNLGKPPKKKPP